MMEKVSIVQWVIVALMCIYVILLLGKGKSKNGNKEQMDEKAENLVTNIILSAKNKKGCVGYMRIDRDIKFDIFTSCSTFGENKDGLWLDSFNTWNKLSKKDVIVILLYVLQKYLKYKK